MTMMTGEGHCMVGDSSQMSLLKVKSLSSLSQTLSCGESLNSISTLLSPGCRAGPSPLSPSREYDGDDPASLSGAVPATYTSSMHRDQPRTNIAYI